MKIIKPGILDTFQDQGRMGYAQLGVGAGGCMDRFAGLLANLLVKNPRDFAVMEIHFPAPVLEFQEQVTIALTGADFGAEANAVKIPNNRPVSLPAHSTLAFKEKLWGQRCYLSIKGGWQLKQVMGSYSTHLKAGFGGFEGRVLRRGDHIPVHDSFPFDDELKQIARWFIYPASFYAKGPIRVMPGAEWDWLKYRSQKQLLNEAFTIALHSDRMGYHLHGPALDRVVKAELLSSGVLPGTIQLLPNGQPLLLMADCQTTGGYPRILQVAEADLPRLAQMGAGEKINFLMIALDEALALTESYNRQLNSLKGAINLR